MLVKTFSLDAEQGNPATRRRIETRLFTKQQGQWAGYTYLWNDDQTDATLVGAGRGGQGRTRSTTRPPPAGRGRRRGTTPAGPSA